MRANWDDGIANFKHRNSHKVWQEKQQKQHFFCIMGKRAGVIMICPLAHFQSPVADTNDKNTNFQAWTRISGQFGQVGLLLVYFLSLNKGDWHAGFVVKSVRQESGWTVNIMIIITWFLRWKWEKFSMTLMWIQSAELLTFSFALEGRKEEMDLQQNSCFSHLLPDQSH